jgi:hypothetical protein
VAVTTPLDRAVRAVAANRTVHGDVRSTDRSDARAALLAALDVDELARVMGEHYVWHTIRQDGPTCRCGWTHDWSNGPRIAAYDRHRAEVIRAHLLGDAEP